MALSQPLYVFSLDPDSDPANPDPVLLLSPVLFKTVFDSREKVVWGLRKTVFRLKLYDLIAFQMQEWETQGKPLKDLHRCCRNIIPLAHVDAQILLLFGLDAIPDEDTSSSSEDFEKYSQKVDEYEESVQDTLTKLDMEKKNTLRCVPGPAEDAGTQPLSSPDNQVFHMTQETPVKPLQMLSQPVEAVGLRSKSSCDAGCSLSQQLSKAEMFTFLGKHVLDKELELPPSLSRVQRLPESVKPESLRSSQTQGSGFSSSVRREIHDAIVENALSKEVATRRRGVISKEHNDARSRQLAERAYTFLKRERRQRMNLDDLCERITKNQPEMMAKSRVSYLP